MFRRNRTATKVQRAALLKTLQRGGVPALRANGFKLQSHEVNNGYTTFWKNADGMTVRVSVGPLAPSGIRIELA